MNIILSYTVMVDVPNVSSVAEALTLQGVTPENLRVAMTRCQHDGCTMIVDAGAPSGPRERATWLCHQHVPRYYCARAQCPKYTTTPPDGGVYTCSTHKSNRNTP